MSLAPVSPVPPLPVSPLAGARVLWVPLPPCAPPLARFQPLSRGSRFSCVYLRVFLSGRKSYFNFLRILNKGGGGSCGGGPHIPRPLRSERGSIGDDDLGWRRHQSHRRAGVASWRPSDPPKPGPDGAARQEKSRWWRRGVPGGVWGGRWMGLGSVVWEAPGGRALGGRRAGVWLGDVARCPAWHWPTHGERQQGCRFWGRKPRNGQICVEEGVAGLGGATWSHSKFPLEPPWGQLCHTLHGDSERRATPLMPPCLSFPTMCPPFLW